MIVSFFAISTCGQFLSADTRKISNQIATGRGFYSENDKIALLNSSNFKSEVYGDTISWFVQFYSSSSCGYCQRFSGTCKTLAQDIYGWSNLVRVAAVDCSIPFNTLLCVDYEVMTYPNLRYFPSGSSQDFLGIIVIDREVASLRQFIIRQLRIESERRTDVPDVFHQYYGTLDEIWNENITFAIIVTENSSSFTGIELALDLNQVEKIKVVSVPRDNENIRSLLNKEGVFLLTKGSKEFEKFGLINESHLYLYDKTRSVLSKKGVNLLLLENKQIS